MNSEEGKSIKEVEDEIARSRERAKELDKEISEAETKHPAPIDHTEDGGVI
jgi:hypothetical protein